MGLEENLAKLSTSVNDGDFSVNIKFSHIGRQFDERNRMLILYSDIEYNAENFHWESTIPTVRIPYRDPALGFLVDGVIFSSVGVYARAPGIVPDVDKRTLNARIIEEPKIDIISARNSTIYIGYKRNAVQIVFKRNSRDYKVPIGIFLKALSGLPYGVILDKFVFKPQTLLNAFPCSIPKGNEDLAKVDTYGIESDEEPSIDECVTMVYRAITQVRDDSKIPQYTTHWKVNRITSFFNNLHFKTRQRYEVTMSVGNRAIGTYLDEDICVPYFKREVQMTERLSPTGKLVKKEKVVESVENYYLPKGHFITADDAREIRRRDIDTLRVRTTRSFLLQESAPMLFRAKGYKLCNDIPEIGAYANDLIDDDLLAKINDTSLGYLEVITPGGRKVLHRSFENVELGDFYTILNYLFTHVYMQKTDTTQYEIGNRVIMDYDKQVRMEVEQTYSDIVFAIAGSTELKNLLDAFPTLPSNRLVGYLRDSKHKEVTQSDITNIMSRAISEGKASAGVQEIPVAMMTVQKGQYGRLDSFHAPDSDKVGSVQQLTILARINEETGEIEAPYEKIVNGVPTGEIEYITAAKENNKYIAAWNCDFSTPTVLVRCNGDVTTAPRERVDYRDPSPFCDMSVSRMCIPFPGFSQPKRALMATKMNGQAVPVLFPERPMVSTGADTEIPALYYTGRQLLELNAVEVVEGNKLELVGYEWKKNVVEYHFIFCNRSFTVFMPFTATDKESLYNYNLNLLNNGYKYDLDDVVFYNHCCDLGDYEYWTRIQQGIIPLVKDYTKPALALGVNVNVCYKTYGSTTVDDALVISDRLISDNTLSNMQIFKYNYKLKQGESFSESDWCPPLYSHVYVKQPVISIIRESSKRGATEKEVLCIEEGELIYASKDDSAREAEVWVSVLHTASIGDKTAGRYGNKSVIAKIVPEWMMPYDPETGITYDVIYNPLGLPSRMNIGQILEVALGAAMLKQSERGKKKISVCTPFYPGIKDEISNLYESEGLQPKRLFNPVYGKLTDRPVMTGVLYIMKLEQMSNLKISAVGYPQAVDPVFGQPVDSVNQDKGQALGEMESWALIASGAHSLLNSFSTLYADDEEARRNYFKLLSSCTETEDNPWNESTAGLNLRKGVNKNALVTQTVMRMFGCDLEVVDNRYSITPLNLADIEVEVTPQAFCNNYEMVRDFEWFTVKLAAPVVNPFWINNFPLHLVLGIPVSVKSIVNGKYYLDINKIQQRDECIIASNSLMEDEKMTMLTGIEAVIELLNNTTVEEAITRIQMKYGSSYSNPTAKGGLNVGLSDTEIVSNTTILDSEEEIENYDIFGDLVDVPMSTADVLRFLERMRRKGQELSMLIWYSMPIMPRMFRQSNIIGDREHKHSFQQQLEGLCSSRSTSQGIYDGLKQLIGYGTSKQDDLVSIRGYFFGRDTKTDQHGKVRGSVLSKRVGFSGRVVIVPNEDPSISPFFIGLPWRLVCVQLAKILAIRLKNRSAEIGVAIQDETHLSRSTVEELELCDWETIVETLSEFNIYILSRYFPTHDTGDLYFVYNYLRSVVKQLVEGNVRRDGLVLWNGEWCDPAELPDDATLDCCVVMVGRQPTLHKKSTRSYFGYLVDGYSMRIHPIVCAEYNADFDGDTMYNVQLFNGDKIEACRTISVMQDLISEKDGSYTLELAQDTALGIYCATTFMNNSPTFEAEAGEFYFFDDLPELRTQLEYGDLHYSDAVIFYSGEAYYCSTAGRILVNGMLPNGFTRKPFTDSYNIFKSAVGDADTKQFCELLYDTVWTATGIKPADRTGGVKIADVLLDVYNTYGARPSIMTAQALYEVGLIASDVVSVSICLDDMSSPVDKTKYMEEPRKVVARLNSLYQLGLITEENRKLATVHAWDTAKNMAQDAIIKALDPNSNFYYMMYSGARGKPDQIMQTVGFIGTISKTIQTDIEYPILHGYGEGLTSLDLSQTAYSARIGVISTQAGTKDTGYATRQSVYMTSGFTVVEDDCGIEVSTVDVRYSLDDICVRYRDGTVMEIDYLLGEFVSSNTEDFHLLKSALNKSGYMINPKILSLIKQYHLTSLCLVGESGEDDTIEIIYAISDKWREKAIESLYSYALPYTDNMKITEETVNWIESHGFQTVVAFDEEAFRDKSYLQGEAYLPVDYDTSRYVITRNGGSVDGEALYTLVIDPATEGYHYFCKLLTEEGNLTERAIKYLTKKQLRKLKFRDGTEADIRYIISDLFRNVVLGRVSVGLLHLDEDSCITESTLDYVEKYQFRYIPVYTGMTCFSKGGICSKCYGKSLSFKQFMPAGSNLGIAASQAMCEPLSQSTLDVSHSGGKRGSGVALLSGLEYYSRMLKGTLTTGRTASLREKFSDVAGYVVQNPHNKSFVQIVSDSGKSETLMLDDSERLNVPNGAYVDVNDTIVSGLPDLHRYDSTDVFDSALKTRYFLMKEYNKIFSSLSVSPRNTETMARAQTSICYLVGTSAKSKTKDTGDEARNPTGQYKLMVSSQAQVVNWFSGIAGYGFENVSNMILMGLLTPEGLPLNSCLGNLITGTRVGSTEAKFIPKTGAMKATKYHKSTVRQTQEVLAMSEHSGEFGTVLSLGSSDANSYSTESEDEILSLLGSGIGAGEPLVIDSKISREEEQEEAHFDFETETVPIDEGEEPISVSGVKIMDLHETSGPDETDDENETKDEEPTFVFETEIVADTEEIPEEEKDSTDQAPKDRKGPKNMNLE